jgi:hypothetical protein
MVRKINMGCLKLPFELLGPIVELRLTGADGELIVILSFVKPEVFEYDRLISDSLLL